MIGIIFLLIIIIILISVSLREFVYYNKDIQKGMEIEKDKIEQKYINTIKLLKKNNSDLKNNFQILKNDYIKLYNQKNVLKNKINKMKKTQK